FHASSSLRPFAHPPLLSFPTRRSSDLHQILRLFLGEAVLLAAAGGAAGLVLGVLLARLLTLVVPALPVSTPWWFALLAEGMAIKIGSTRLNSSHVAISYAVFCLKKKHP